MRSGAYGSVGAMAPLLEHLAAGGHDVAAVLAAADIPPALGGDGRARLPQRRFERLWRAAIAATGDEALALRVATAARLDALGVIGYLAAASDTRRTAFELVRGLTPLLWEDFDCALEIAGDTALLRYRSGSGRRLSRFTVEYAVGLTVAMSRGVGAAGCEPLEARFAYAAPPWAAAYHRILRLPVRFDAAESGVLFPLSMLDRLNPSADAALRQLLERHAADQLARLPGGARLAPRVRAAVRSLLPAGDVSAGAVAARFAMSDRTLRRRLTEEATSYQTIVDEVRAELAAHYLARERRAVEEVAHLLGFSDQSAFTKAFRRWRGHTPAAFARARRGS